MGFAGDCMNLPPSNSLRKICTLYHMQPDIFCYSEPKLRIRFGNSWAKLRPVQYVLFIFEKASSMICHLNGPMLVEF